MHALNWLKCSTQYTPTLIQPIEGVHFYRFHFCSRYRGLCDRAFKGFGYFLYDTKHNVHRLTLNFLQFEDTDDGKVSLKILLADVL